jgi:DNA-directed RNA polymerases I, II, and III subunit RPABC2|tara:strand:- start:4158 stop:4421 length:264 start_codon:yes stop_codon:yes gene_type:complete
MEKTGRCLNKDERISSNRLTEYEKARLLGTRALQIDNDAPIFVDIDGETSSQEIALKELIEKKIPLIIERILPNGDWELWSIDELVI